MEGILIASSDGAVRRSLSAIVAQGRTVLECNSIAQTLTLAAAQRADCIFVDDVFEDGTGEQLVARLHHLGYGPEIVPVLVSDQPQYLEAFKAFGVHHSVSKPFDAQRVVAVIDQIGLAARALAGKARWREQTGPQPAPFAGVPVMSAAGAAAFGHTEIREISQRFRRLLERVLRKDDLVAVFADTIQEQFDVDNVVVLLPDVHAPCFRVVKGGILAEVREQFLVPFGEPWTTELTRRGEPVWLSEWDQLGLGDGLAAVRCGERLEVQLLCPVVCRGRLRAVVGLSRIHRYSDRALTVSLLRLFLTFFATALQNASIHRDVSSAEQTFRGIFDVLPVGAVAVSAEGIICQANRVSADYIGLPVAELLGRPVEHAGSRLADVAHQVLESGAETGKLTLEVGKVRTDVSGVPLDGNAENGVLLVLHPTVEQPLVAAVAGQETEFDAIMADMSKALAHNFKNALVPVKTCAELLPERYEHEGFRQSFFEVVQDSIAKIDTWIASLLRFSQADTTRRQTAKQSLHELIEEGLQRARTEFPELRLRIHRDFCTDDQVNGAREALTQAFCEAIRNALDALQDVADPVLRVVTQREGNSVIAVIEDNGRGITPEAQNAVLRPFFTKKLTGLGLGLAFVKKVADLHGGSVEVKPGASGGTTVRLSLPAEVRTRITSL